MPPGPHKTYGFGHAVPHAHGSLRVLLQFAHRGPWRESKRSCHAAHWSGGREALLPVHGEAAAEAAAKTSSKLRGATIMLRRRRLQELALNLRLYQDELNTLAALVCD